MHQSVLAPDNNAATISAPGYSLAIHVWLPHHRLQLHASRIPRPKVFVFQEVMWFIQKSVTFRAMDVMTTCQVHERVKPMQVDTKMFLVLIKYPRQSELWNVFSCFTFLNEVCFIVAGYGI